MTHTPWPERSAIYELLRYGRKHDGPWTEAITGDQLIDEENAHLFAASPDMELALLAVERADQLSNVCGDDPDAIEEWLEASNDAMEKVNAVLKRLRDAGVIEKAEDPA